jgi:peroxiredoxin
MPELTPRQDAPSLSISLTTGGTWSLGARVPEDFTMIVFYRGLHCPVCQTYLSTLDQLVDDYRAAGTHPIAVSMDDEERAQRAVEEWGLETLPVGYGLSEEDARQWGLYLSEGIKEDEPVLFSEPGLFLVRPDGTLYYAAVNSMPFGRPDPEGLLESIRWIEEHDYPARGEVRAQPAVS